ncbi:MAG: hypothetical protein K6E12_09640 [Saccharofermentans sp.]|nr:hypothetical protein [Saccharofermentans sp.]
MGKKDKKLSIASVIGFSLAVLSLVLIQFFVFNDSIMRAFSGWVFHRLEIPVTIGIALSHIGGYVFSILGLKNINRKKLRGKGFSIAGLFILVPQTALIVIAFLVIFLIASSGPSFG